MTMDGILAVRVIDNTIRETQVQRHNLSYAVRHLRNTSGDSVGSGRPSREAQRNLNEFDRNMQYLRLQQEQARLVAEFNLRRIIVAMAEQNMLLEVYKTELVLAGDSYRRMSIMSGFGLVSDRDLSVARYRFAGHHTRLDEHQRRQENTKQELNILLGQPLNQNTIITSSIVLPGLPGDLTHHIHTLVRQAPSIQMLQAEVDSALDARWVYTGDNRNIIISTRDRQRAWAEERPRGYTGPQHTPTEEILQLRNRLALQEAVERTIFERDRAMQALEAAIRQGFNDYAGLLDRADILDTQLTQTKAALETILFEYELGLVAQYEVEYARLASIRAGHNIEILNMQKWILSFRLENPSLL